MSDGAELTADKLGILGRERFIVHKVTKDLHKLLLSRYDHTDIREHRRGEAFDIVYANDEGVTGHILRITVELERSDFAATESPK